MAQREEFEVTIDKDGRIRLDFRGMEESSYRRILEVLRETVGPVEPIELPTEEEAPPRVVERPSAKTGEAPRLKTGG